MTAKAVLRKTMRKDFISIVKMETVYEFHIGYITHYYMVSHFDKMLSKTNPRLSKTNACRTILKHFECLTDVSRQLPLR